ncbi:MAG: DUF3426 domain-containing protein [Alphaproteobacteria bacterium]|nr:DUF3426 domain-containing protein [Alphaproteobacteria bacterium]
MILTCLSCETRFNVPDAAIGTAGREVKCSRCAHRWHAMAAAAGPPPPLRPRPALRESPATLPAMTVSVEPAQPPMPPGIVSRQRAAPPPSPAPKPSPARLRLAVLALVAALVLLGGVLWFLRADLVAAWTPAGRIYAAIGLEAGPPAPGAGLAVRNTTFLREGIDGMVNLAIRGEIANVDSEAHDVPPVVAVLIDKAGKELQRVTLSIDAASLDHGEAAAFVTRIANPHREAAQVNFTFAAAP